MQFWTLDLWQWNRPNWPWFAGCLDGISSRVVLRIFIHHLRTSSNHRRTEHLSPQQPSVSSHETVALMMSFKHVAKSGFLYCCRREGYVFAFVCLSVSRITQKVVHEFWWNYLEEYQQLIRFCCWSGSRRGYRHFWRNLYRCGIAQFYAFCW